MQASLFLRNCFCSFPFFFLCLLFLPWMPVIPIFQRFMKNMREILWWFVPWLFADFCAWLLQFFFSKCLATILLGDLLRFGLFFCWLAFFIDHWRIVTEFFHLCLSLPKSRVFLGREWVEDAGRKWFGSLAKKCKEHILHETNSNRPWKWMIGRLVSFWDDRFSGANC